MKISYLVGAVVWAVALASAMPVLGSNGVVFDSSELHTSPPALLRVNNGCPPAIEFTYVPPYGSFDNLEGRVTCVDPAFYKVAVYIYVSGWWTKPFWTSPLTPIQADGAWITDITTGGIDQNATKIVAYLVPNGYDPPLMNGGQALPPELEENSVASVLVEREPIFRTLEFSGYIWNVKASETPVGPGPNYFSDREEEVWVDEDGQLHLRIVYRNGRWYSSEIFTTDTLGYGRYTFTLASRVDQLDKNAVLGLFTWDDTAPEYNYREIDIEFARWGVDENDNAQYVVQPWDHAGNLYRFNMELQTDYSTHRFDWWADSIQFSSFQGHESPPDPGDEIESWLYTGPDIPPAGTGNARLNLWLLNGNPPADGQEVEVIIEAFEFVPTTQNDSHQIFLPIIEKSAGESAPPPLGAAIGFTGANDGSRLGRRIHFPSLRKNDAGWTSSVAIQNTTLLTTTLTLEFFRENGTVAHAVSNIPLPSYGTHIVSLADFTPLADGSYALAVTATELIAGVVSARNAAGTMAIAYEGTGQGSQRLVAPIISKNHSGWTTRLCVHNMTSGIAKVMTTYYDQNESLISSRQLDLPGNGVECTDLEQESLLPAPFVGMARIISDTDIAATVENVSPQANRALGYLGFDLLVGSNTSYIPRCWKEGGWQTHVRVANAGPSTSDVTINYREFDGSIGYTQTYPWGFWFGFACPGYPVGIIIPPPEPLPYHLGSAIVSMNQSELIALVTEGSASTGTDVFSYAGLPVSSSVTYAPNVGTGLNTWRSILSIQNPKAMTNTVKAFFYNQAGELLHELATDLSPYGMNQYDVAQLPGLSTTYEGSAIISAAAPVTVLVNKER